MASKVEICNLAISNVGTGKTIADFELERSSEAAACRQYYAVALKGTLRDFPWPFATKHLALALVQEDPTEEWAYSYRYPTDCVKMRRILSGNRVDTRQSRVPYRISSDASGKLIYTDKYQAVAEYTYLVENTQLYDDSFVNALAWRLASLLSPRLSQGNPFKIAERCRNEYMRELLKAEREGGTEDQPEEEPASEFDRGRE